MSENKLLLPKAVVRNTSLGLSLISAYDDAEDSDSDNTETLPISNESRVTNEAKETVHVSALNLPCITKTAEQSKCQLYPTESLPPILSYTRITAFEPPNYDNLDLTTVEGNNNTASQQNHEQMEFETTPSVIQDVAKDIRHSNNSRTGHQQTNNHQDAGNIVDPDTTNVNKDELDVNTVVTQTEVEDHLVTLTPQPYTNGDAVPVGMCAEVKERLVPLTPKPTHDGPVTDLHFVDRRRRHDQFVEIFFSSDSESDSESSSKSTETVESSDETSSDEEDLVAPLARIATQEKKVVEPCSHRTKGELSIHDLPPIEDLQISVPESDLKHIGYIESIVDIQVIIQSFPNEPPLDLDSVLFLSGGKPLGKVFDVLGPVVCPFYSVRFNSRQDIENHEIKIGDSVYCAPRNPDVTIFVFMEDLKKMKGTDASWKDNNEPPAQFQDFSDDEEERMFKQKLRAKHKPDNNADNNCNNSTPARKPRIQNANPLPQNHFLRPRFFQSPPSNMKFPRPPGPNFFPNRFQPPRHNFPAFHHRPNIPDFNLRLNAPDFHLRHSAPDFPPIYEGPEFQFRHDAPNFYPRNGGPDFYPRHDVPDFHLRHDGPDFHPRGGAFPSFQPLQPPPHQFSPFGPPPRTKHPSFRPLPLSHTQLQTPPPPTPNIMGIMQGNTPPLNIDLPQDNGNYQCEPQYNGQNSTPEVFRHEPTSPSPQPPQSSSPPCIRKPRFPPPEFSNSPQTIPSQTSSCNQSSASSSWSSQPPLPRFGNGSPFNPNYEVQPNFSVQQQFSPALNTTRYSPPPPPSPTEFNSTLPPPVKGFVSGNDSVVRIDHNHQPAFSPNRSASYSPPLPPPASSPVPMSFRPLISSPPLSSSGFCHYTMASPSPVQCTFSTRVSSMNSPPTDNSGRPLFPLNVLSSFGGPPNIPNSGRTGNWVPTNPNFSEPPESSSIYRSPYLDTNKKC